jgi:hypothetical protein
MMRFQTFIETCFLIMFLSLICVSDDLPFISIAGDCRYPAVASEGKGIYLVWLEVEGKDAGIFFRRSMDEGKEWSGARRISNKDGDCYPPAIAVNSGMVHAAWVDYGETIDGELYYTRSFNGGETWEKNAILINKGNSARLPMLAASGDDVFLAWQDEETKIFFMGSHDKGMTWDTPVLLAKCGIYSCYCRPPALAISGKELRVVWSDVREDKKGFKLAAFGFPLVKKSVDVISAVACRTSPDGGRTWGKEQLLTATKVKKETEEEIENPVMISGGPLSYLFWIDKRNIALGEIFYARFEPKTDIFPVTGKNLLPDRKRSPKRPSVVFDNGRRFHFTWASFLAGQSTICYSQCDPEGNILIDKKELTSDTGRYYDPAITMTPSGLLHVFWFDQPKDKNGWSRIFLKTSKDDGLTWEAWGSQKKERYH